MKKILWVLVILIGITCIEKKQLNAGWMKTFGGAGDDNGYSVQQTQDGGYIIAGATNSYGAGYSDVWLIKTDSLGDTLWIRTYGGIYYDDGRSLQQTSDGGYIIAGETVSYDVGNGDVWLIKTDANGGVLWTRTYGGADVDWGTSVQQTSDGGYIIAGCTHSGTYSYDVWLIKTGKWGDTLWTRTFGGTGRDRSNSVQQTSDGGYIIVGYTVSYGADSGDVLLIKTDSLGYVGIEEKSNIKNQNVELEISPSICFSTINIKAYLPQRCDMSLELYNISGRRVKELFNGSVSAGEYNSEYSIRDIKNGIYFLRLKSPFGVSTEKITVVR